MGRRHFVSVFAFCLVLSACERKAEQPRSGAEPVPVTIVEARKIPWPEVVSVPATVSAVDTALLASRAGGWVTSVEVDAGAHVAKGALLAEVGAADARERLAEAQSRLTAAQATLNEAANNERRSHTLLRAHDVSAQQYEAAHRRFLTASADVDAARAALNVARTNLDYAEIRAPFAGIVAQKNVRTGDFAAPGATLFVLASDKPQIRAYVGSKTFDAIKVGEKAEVVLDDRSVSATVTLASAAADPKTRAHLVELLPQSPIDAPYGSYAELRLTLSQVPQLVLPDSALVRRAGLLGAFVVDPSGRAHFRLVRSGEARDGLTAIQAGLAPGEMVIDGPPASLVNGALVKARNATSGARVGDVTRD